MQVATIPYIKASKLQTDEATDDPKLRRLAKQVVIRQWISVASQASVKQQQHQLRPDLFTNPSLCGLQGVRLVINHVHQCRHVVPNNQQACFPSNNLAVLLTLIVCIMVFFSGLCHVFL